MADENNCNGSAEDKRAQLRESKTNAHIEQVVLEKHKLECTDFPIASRLLDEELQKTKDTGKASFDYRYIDLYNERPMKVVVRVQFPTKDVPTFNFVGKLLGPGGNNLRALQDATKCRILILGKGSMRDKAKEEEMRNSGDPKYAHLSDELHVEVSCVAPPTEAHSRMAFALRELRGVLVPDPPTNDFGYMEGPMAMHGPREPRRPPMLNPPSSAKAMSFLEKARHSMDFSPAPPPRRFGPPPRAYKEPPIYEGDGRGQWVSGYKPPNAGGRFFPNRSAPYSRP